MDTTGTGTRSEYPVKRPSSSGITLPRASLRRWSKAQSTMRREPRADLFRLIVQRPAVGVGMGGVHETMFNTEMLVQDLCSRCKTIGGAASVADHVVFIRGVKALINAHHNG